MNWKKKNVKKYPNFINIGIKIEGFGSHRTAEVWKVEDLVPKIPQESEDVGGFNLVTFLANHVDSEVHLTGSLK